ncbi:MAG: hypothetical protein SFW36_13885 [Leptolyngbyaceae cyanobacterium bins.59]|nr:hypothetical protein [Leptolyngbyaceae cyanobacterium bins.59]
MECNRECKSQANCKAIEFPSTVMEMMTQLEMDDNTFQAMVVELVELELTRRQREQTRRRAWAAQHRITARRTTLKVI